MKQTLAVLMAAALMVPAFGQGVIKGREKEQRARIKEGVKDGSITKAEAAKLRREQKYVRQDVRAAKSDGQVTAGEKAHITREQNKASRDIYKQKHDAQDQK